MILAEKTLKAIHDAIMADSGASFRVWQGKVLPHIADAYSPDPERGYRSHLGGSQIGKDCERAIYYGFRWVGADTKTPEELANWSRMLRLFNRGHLEEGRFIALLLAAGMRVRQQNADGRQMRFRDVGGHFAGSVDGVVFGCPDSPDGKPGLVEFKTYKHDRFKQLVKNGVQFNDPTYYTQLQVYMQKMGLRWALFMAVDKDDETLHAEIVHYNPDEAGEARKKAINIIFADKVPHKVRGAKPAYFKCKFCDYKQVCHLGRPADENCRTCRYSVPLEEMTADEKGTWHCRLNAHDLTKEQQEAGCEHYAAIPNL